MNIEVNTKYGKWNINLTAGDTLYRLKSRKSNVESDVYVPSRGANIPCKGIKA